MDLGWFEYPGAFFGIIGALCQCSTQMRIKYYGFMSFVLSDISLVAVGLADSRYAFFGLQLAFSFIASYGVWAHRPSRWPQHLNVTCPRSGSESQ